MWDDGRLLAAIAAMPPEAFVEGPPEDGELLWRRAVKRLRDEPEVELAPGHLAPVLRLPVRPPLD
jgi:hypothetical protein